MNEKKITTLADVMTREVIMIEPKDTVHDAINLMREHKTSSLIVNRRDEADEYGIVVVTDIARDVLGKNLSPERVNVYDIMSKPVVALGAGMNVVYAVRMLVRFKLSRTIVVDDNRVPIGVVTLRDMVLRGMTTDG